MHQGTARGHDDVFVGNDRGNPVQQRLCLLQVIDPDVPSVNNTGDELLAVHRFERLKVFRAAYEVQADPPYGRCGQDRARLV